MDKDKIEEKEKECDCWAWYNGEKVSEKCKEYCRRNWEKEVEAFEEYCWQCCSDLPDWSMDELCPGCDCSAFDELYDEDDFPEDDCFFEECPEDEEWE